MTTLLLSALALGVALPVAAAPLQPLVLQSRAVDTGTVRILWIDRGDPDGELVEYQIEEVGNPTRSSGWLAPGATSWDATGLPTGWSGRWQVQARNGSGELSTWGTSEASRSLEAPLEGFGLGGGENVGGLNGDAYVVTTLADSGPGSLRDALSESNRYITFAVGGTIYLDSQIRLGSKEFITVDASTAPAPGITLEREFGNILLLDESSPDMTNNVIIRHLRFVNNRETGGDCLAIGGAENDSRYGAYNIIIDHCSMRRAFDGNLDIADHAHDVTIQWCILAENTKNQIIRAGAYNVTSHHNLYADYYERGPAVKEQSGDGVVEVVNNVNYDWNNHGQHWVGTDTGQEPSEGNTVGNYFIPASASDLDDAILFNPGNQAYSSGHYFYGGSSSSGTPGRSSRHSAPALATETSAEQALIDVLLGAGAQPRDGDDEGYVRRVTDVVGEPDPPDNDPPHDPSGVDATSLGTTRIRVSWTNNGDPDGDPVEFRVREVSDGGISSGWLSSGTTSWDATGLDPATTYRFEVQGRDDAGATSGWVESNSATTDAPPPPSNDPPHDPGDVNATPEGSSSIRIDWTDNGDPDGDSVQFQIRETSDHGLSSGWLAVGTTTWTVNGLDPGTTYRFEVQGRDDGDPQEFSAWVESNSATTDPLPPVNTPPNDPSAVLATVEGATSIRITWTDNGDPDGDGVTFRVREVTDSGIDSGWLGAGVAEWTATGLEPETTYRFEVEGRDDGDPQEFSAWVESNSATTDPLSPVNTPPNDPSAVLATVEGATSIRITWTDNGDPDGDGVTFRVLEVTDSGIDSGWLGAGVAEWTATGLEPETTYRFEVQGRDDGDPQEFSAWVESNDSTTSAEPTINEPPNAPTGIFASAEGATNVRVSWTDNGDPDGDGVEFQVREISVSGIASGWLSLGVSAWEATGLDPETTYQFEVQARDDGNPTAVSAWFPSNATTTEPLTADPPADPVAVFARIVSTSTVRIIWSDPGDDAEHRVEEIGNPSRSSGWLTAGVTSWEATGLPAGWAGTWRVQARNPSGDTSGWTDSDPSRTLEQPLEGFGVGGGSNVGGLDGDTYVVTNLDDSGAGSLRDALSESNRYITFAVGGTIELESQIRLGSAANITVDASTAPSPGITLRREFGNILLLDESDPEITHNVIIRYLRFVSDRGTGGDCLAIGGDENDDRYGAYNIVIDHCSFRRAFDGNLDVTDHAHDITIQWCILAENTKNQIIRAGAYDITLHHNLYADYNERGPAVKEQFGAGIVDVVNNVNFDWNNHGQHWVGTDTGQEPSEGNTVGNYFIPSSASDLDDGILLSPGNQAFSSGNVFRGGSDIDGSPGRSTRYPAPALSTETSAEEALEAVLTGAGAHPRDADDAGYVANAYVALGSNAPPIAPTVVNATAQGTSTVLVTWADNGDPDGDDVAYQVREVSSSAIASGWLSAGVTSWQATELEPGTTYRFEVQGRDDGDPVAYTVWVQSNSVTTEDDGDPLNNPPNDPTIVRANVRSSTQVQITWANNGDPDGDEVEFYVREVSDSDINSGWLGAGVISWEAAGLTPGTAYQFEVRGRDDGSPVATTSWVQSNAVSTLPSSDDVTPPAVVSDLEIDQMGETTALLVWTAPGDDGSQGRATSYDLRYSESEIDDENDFAAATAVIGLPSPLPAGQREEATVDGLASDTWYFFALVAIDEAGNRSPMSTSVSGQTLPPETAPLLPPGAPDVSYYEEAVRVEWSASAIPEIGYHVYRRTEEETESERLTAGNPIVSNESTIEYVDDTVVDDTGYFYSLTVVDSEENESPHSAEVFVLAELPPVEAPGGSFSDDAVTITWAESVIPEAAYHVYRRAEDQADTESERLTGAPVPDTEYVDPTVVEGMGYFYRVTVVDGLDNESPHSPETFVRAASAVPASVYMDRIYPNPVRTQATFRFGVPESASGATGSTRVTIDLYDVAGHRVGRIVEGDFPPGIREVTWRVGDSGTRVAPGMYVTVLRAGGSVVQERIAVAP